MASQHLASQTKTVAIISPKATSWSRPPYEHHRVPISIKQRCSVFVLSLGGDHLVVWWVCPESKRLVHIFIGNVSTGVVTWSALLCGACSESGQKVATNTQTKTAANLIWQTSARFYATQYVSLGTVLSPQLPVTTLLCGEICLQPHAPMWLCSLMGPNMENTADGTAKNMATGIGWHKIKKTAYLTCDIAMDIVHLAASV